MKILPVPDLVLNVRSRWRDEGRECEEKPWSPDIPKKEKEKKEKERKRKKARKNRWKRKHVKSFFLFSWGVTGMGKMGTHCLHQNKRGVS